MQYVLRETIKIKANSSTPQIVSSREAVNFLNKNSSRLPKLFVSMHSNPLSPKFAKINYQNSEGSVSPTISYALGSQPLQSQSRTQSKQSIPEVTVTVSPTNNSTMGVSDELPDAIVSL